MTTPPDDDRLRELDEKLARFRKAQAPSKPHQEEHYSQAQLAWRMVTELVAGLAIGFGMGYGIDVLAGTTPWFLVVFTLLGFVAGVKTMMRTANEIQASRAARPAGETETKAQGDQDPGPNE